MSLRFFKLTLAYEGTAYNGWQVQRGQPHTATVQGKIEEALFKITGQETKVVAAGRTDAGVHARSQVISLFLDTSLAPLSLIKALNSALPADIVFYKAEEAEVNFNARKDASAKSYRYFLDLNPFPCVFGRNYSLYFPFTLDFQKMQAAASLLTGSHNFRAFCAKGTTPKSYCRTVYDAKWVKKEKVSYFEITANGFLYKMVRLLVGAMLEVGRCQVELEDFKEMLYLQREDKRYSVRPHGLFLWEIYYGEDFLKEDNDAKNLYGQSR